MPLTTIKALEFTKVFAYMESRYDTDIFERGI
jgi:hypothetical protein